ncbi:MAG: aminomethyltransferase family protein, partial [Alphaproteobacteria bacterium]|nr:aminomethyltransferase family protein [Alphaproteobacteria bacterium]
SLGKIDVQGPDAGEFLDRVYVNKWRTFRVNRAKYGVMLRDDGIVLDDGTTSRISEDHYFMTTTTANESKVLEHLEFLLDIAWPALRVHVTSVTDQWAGAAVAGPRSRDLLLGVVTGCDLGNESFRPMSVGHGEIAGCPVRICRLSYSGELAFEIYTPAGFGEAIWSCLIEQGRPLGLTVYGNDALNTLRIEKGHVAGPELDGRTTLGDLGLAKMGKRGRPFVGSVLMNRPGLLHKDRPRLVGLRARHAADRLVPGALLFPLSGAVAGHGLGRVTSATFSPALQCYIGLGLVSGDAIHSCAGLKAANPVENETVIVDVVSPVFVDPEGKRSNA